MTAKNNVSERLLVLLPTRKDTERASSLFRSVGIECHTCSDVKDLCDEITRGAGAALLYEEAVLLDRSHSLGKVLEAEPPWSNFPLVVFSKGGLDRITFPAEMVLNVTLVERPVKIRTLKSVVDAALRHRRRQYELRSVLQDLKGANEELELRVKERTAKLQEMVAELEAFSYSVSHDLRSPLRAMQGYAQALLEEEGLSEQGRHYVSRIEHASGRLDRLVQDVLAYSKVAKGEISLQPNFPAAIVEEVVRSYPELREQGTVAVHQPIPAVLAHEGYLTQCISNLLTNALKFVRPNVKPKIDVSAEVSGKEVHLLFRDNGIGIASQYREEIFKLFGRVHSEKEYPGTGIGLAIVKKAAERMGGSISFESEPGCGTCFCLTLQSA